MVDEQEDGGLFGAVVRIGGQPLCLKRPAVIRRGELGELRGNAAPVNLAYPVYARSTSLDGNACRGLAVLLTRKGDIGAVDGVPPNHVDDLVVLVRSGPEGSPTGRDVVK